MQLLSKHNDVITIASTPFAKGGEGSLYEVVSPGSLRHLCAKIYHVDKRVEERERKIAFLLEHNPNDTYERDVLVWVEDILYQGDDFMGFLMPKQSGVTLEILCSNSIAKRFQSDWGYLSLKNDNALKKRMEIACRLCMAVHQLHESQRYLLIDIKPENIVIDQFLDVFIVDLDSVEVLDNGKTIFDAPVSTPEYTPPEHYKKLDYDPTEKMEWDLFGLGVIMYKLLCGIHPYTGTCNPPYDQFITISSKIEQGLIPLSEKKELFDVIPGPHGRFDVLPKDIQNLFEACLLYGADEPTKRPSALDWTELLLLHCRNEGLVQQFYHVFDHAPLTHIATPSFKEYSFDSSVLENAELTKLKEIENQSETFWWWSPIRFNGWMYRKFSLEVILKINKTSDGDPSIYIMLGVLAACYSEWILSVLFILSIIIYAFAFFHKRMKEYKGQFYSLQKKIVVAWSLYKSLKGECAKTGLHQLQRTLKDQQKLQISITNFNAFIQHTNQAIYKQLLSKWIKTLTQSGIYIQSDSFWGLRIELTKFFKIELDRFIDRLGLASFRIKDQITPLRKAINDRFDADKKQLIDSYITKLQNRINEMDIISPILTKTYWGDEQIFEILSQNGIVRFSDIRQFNSSRNEIWLTTDSEMVRLPVPRSKSDEMMKGWYQWRDEYKHFSYLLKKVTVEKIYPDDLVMSFSEIEKNRNEQLSKSYDQIYDAYIPSEARDEFDSLIAKKQMVNDWILKHNQEYTTYLEPYSREYQKRYDITVQKIQKIRRNITLINKDINSSESKKLSDLLEKMFDAHSSLMEFNDQLLQLINDVNDNGK